MLSDRNIAEMNRQIAAELRNADSICSTPEEKMQALERIAKLRELLTPQPTREDILTELASALKGEQKKSAHEDITIGDIFAAFRRR